MLTPTATLTPTLVTSTRLVPVQRLISVPVERVRTVKRPVTLWREEDVVVDDDAEERSSGAATEPVRVEEWKEEVEERAKANGGARDVILDIDDRSPPFAPTLSSSSLSSLMQPLSAPSPLPAAASSYAARLRQYNPRVVQGYAQRMRPGSRTLIAVPAESLPPPPFRSPSYPLSSVPPPIAPASVFPSLVPSASTSPPPSLSISIPDAYDPSSSSQSSSNPFPSSSASAFSDPTTLLATGLILRNASELPRGSPRHLLAGVTIAAVQPASRAAQSGLQEDDELLRVHGREVRSAEEAVSVVNLVPGPLDVIVRRGGDLVALRL